LICPYPYKKTCRYNTFSSPWGTNVLVVGFFAILLCLSLYNASTTTILTQRELVEIIKGPEVCCVLEYRYSGPAGSVGTEPPARTQQTLRLYSNRLLSVDDSSMIHDYDHRQIRLSHEPLFVVIKCPTEESLAENSKRLSDGSA